MLILTLLLNPDCCDVEGPGTEDEDDGDIIVSLP